MRLTLRSVVEAVAPRLFGVDQYLDIFERLAQNGWTRSFAPSLLRHKVRADVRSSPVLFIHVPKNGGTSIKQVLYRSDPGHASVRFYDMIDPGLLMRAESFALIREPIDRFLSGFDFLMQRGGSDVTIQPGPLRRLLHITSPDEFLDYLESIAGDWLQVDTFARPQWWYLVDRSRTIRVKNLWLLGAQQREVSEFLLAHGVPAPRHLNATRRATRELTAVQERRVRALYRDDFEIYAKLCQSGGESVEWFGQRLARA